MLRSPTRRFSPSSRLYTVRFIGLFVVVMLMLSCQHVPSPPITLTPQPESETAAVEPEPVTPPFQVEANPVLTRWALQIPDDSPSGRANRPEVSVQTSSAPMRVGRPAIAAALGKATIHPRESDFDQAVMYFDYVEGGLYHLDVGLDAPMLVIFPPGEEVLLAGGLDQKRFLVKEQAERVEGDPTVYMVIAFEPGVCGHYTFVTVKGRYLLKVCSQVKPGLVAVAWKHSTASEPAPRAAKFPAPGEYRVGYKIAVSSGQPIWTPLGVWDTADKGKTLILFPKERLTSSAPVILILGPGGTRQVTNGRARGQWFEVDRLATALELRSGHDKHAEVVTITRSQEYRAIRCPGAPECPPDRTLTENPQ